MIATVTTNIDSFLHERIRADYPQRAGEILSKAASEFWRFLKQSCCHVAFGTQPSSKLAGLMAVVKMKPSAAFCFWNTTRRILAMPIKRTRDFLLVCRTRCIAMTFRCLFGSGKHQFESSLCECSMVPRQLSFPYLISVRLPIPTVFPPSLVRVLCTARLLTLHSVFAVTSDTNATFVCAILERNRRKSLGSVRLFAPFTYFQLDFDRLMHEPIIADRRGFQTKERTMMTRDEILNADSRTIDRRVAETVMGWTHPHDIGGVMGEWMNGVVRTGWRCDGKHKDGTRPFTPSEDAASDYEVLVHVREKWTPEMVCAVRDGLDLMWCERAEASREVPGTVWGCTQYQPGDYAKAALLAAESEAR